MIHSRKKTVALMGLFAGVALSLSSCQNSPSQTVEDKSITTSFNKHTNHTNVADTENHADHFLDLENIQDLELNETEHDHAAEMIHSKHVKPFHCADSVCTHGSKHTVNKHRVFPKPYGMKQIP